MSQENYIMEPKVKPNDEWKVKLFPHQLTAIWMMEEREHNQTRKIITSIFCDDTELNTNIGVYSDPTGYGKTLSVVGLSIL